MPRDDAAAAAAEQDITTELDLQLGGPAGHGPIRVGGPVMAGPPDDALEMARQELFAALFGGPTPGAM